MKSKGYTLIEVVVYIVVLGVIASGLFVAFNSSLITSSNPGKIMAANQLAKARMSIILHYRLVNGFANITDPCYPTSSVNACTALATFATNNGLTVSSSIPAASGGIRTATISISGEGASTLTMRFVE
jgi:prepilin-type N-terminal cleavage/methylation domain-containing protein